jgi:hypothetical protein
MESEVRQLGVNSNSIYYELNDLQQRVLPVCRLQFPLCKIESNHKVIN